MEINPYKEYKEYVLVYAKYTDGQQDFILVINKQKPLWQKDRLNLPGGAIEKGETPEHAAIRELKEESGFDIKTAYTDGRLESDEDGKYTAKIIGAIAGDFGFVYVVEVPIDFSFKINPREGEKEKVEWKQWLDIRDSKLLIPNLKVIIPLLMNGVKGWEITDSETSAGKSTHEFKIKLKTGWKDPVDLGAWE